MPAYKSSEYVNESDSEVEDVEFQAPKHFSKISSGSNLDFSDEKEIWLIKAPKGFPIKNLKSLPVSFTATSISNGPETFKAEHNNKKGTYQINEELLSAQSENRKNAVFVRGKKTFKVLKGEVSRFYNIRETILIPEIDIDKVVQPRKDVKKIKNLRMRHFPTGY
ncbi:RNA polymerase I, subunit RPA34.5, partial [Suhomyces tanzawaensis NRRL Y-17324]